MFTIKQLESFKLTVQHGTTAQAAAHQHTTESAVAKRLRELENALGVTLFERDGRRQVLTAKGEDILPLALRLLDVRNAIREAAHSPTYQAHTCRLGMTELVAHHWLTALVEDIRQHHPQLQIEPHIGLSLEMEELLRQGDLDLAILPAGTRLPHMTYTTLFRSPNVWVSQPGYLPGKSRLDAHQLSRLPLVLQHQQSLLHQTVLKWFAARDAPQPRLVTCNSLKGTKDLVIAGFGVAYLPEYFCRTEIADGTLESFEVRPALPERTYYAVHPAREVPGLAMQLAEIVRASLRGRLQQPA